MARKADASSVSDAIRPADFRGAVMLIRTIDAKKDKIASVNGEIGDIWAKVEGKKVSKAAGKMFLTLDKKEPDDRVTIMRDLNKLIDAAGWSETAADLVDMAEDNVVQMRAGKGKAAAAAEADGEEGDEAGGEEAGDPEPPKGSALARFKESRAKVEDHLSGKTAH
jgi:hypothetical protein